MRPAVTPKARAPENAIAAATVSGARICPRVNRWSGSEEGLLAMSLGVAAPREVSPSMSQPSRLLRAGLVPALALVPLLIWAAVTLSERSRALHGAASDMSRVTETFAEQAARMLQVQALVLGLVDRAAGERSCAELRADPEFQGLLSAAVARAAQVDGAWLIDDRGFVCMAHDPAIVDTRSRAFREYFLWAKGAERNSFFVDRAIVGLARGTPSFSVARRRGADGFRGLVLTSVDLRDIIAYWQTSVAVRPTQRVAIVRADGAFVARSWAPLVPLPDAEAERRLAATWADAPTGTIRRPSVFDGEMRITAWRSLPEWGVVVTAGIAEREALAAWRAAAARSGALAAASSALLAVFLWTLLRAQRRLTDANQMLEAAVAGRTAELEAARARLDARLDAWFEHGAEALFMVSVTPDGRFVYDGINPALERSTGLRAADLRGRTPAEAFPAEVAAGLEANYRRCLEADGPVTYEEEPELPVGRRLWETTLVPVREPGGGRVELILGSSRDVTDQRRQQARDAQRQRLEALGQLAGGIAHDFNNVMQAVQGGATLIRKRSGDPAAVERFARMVDEAAARGASVTRRLLAFARRDELRAELVDMPALLAGVQEVLEHTLGSGIEVRVEAPAALPQVLVDRGQLETLLVNLATNARDAMPGGGRLTLAAGAETVGIGDPDTASVPPGRYLRLAVADTGDGMAPEVLRRASEPFFTTKAPGKGTGLGLAMARGFAEQSGGALAIESAPGAGTTVTLWLPAVTGGAEDGTLEGAPDGGAAARSCVLVVDDEPLVREVLAEGLEQRGFCALRARDGGDALAILDAGVGVNLLLTDLAMPGMDGLALVRAARERLPGLPVVLLTGNAGDGRFPVPEGRDAEDGVRLLRKPVSDDELAREIADALTEAEPAAPAA
jgi:PAS domain S-box-containing protein